MFLKEYTATNLQKNSKAILNEALTQPIELRRRSDAFVVMTKAKFIELTARAEAK